jgi:hypothetical protein
VNHLIFKVCICSLGRVGVVSGQESMTFNGEAVNCWVGMGLDGRGPWVTSADKPIVVIAESLGEYTGRVMDRPGNLMYAKGTP